MQTLQLTASADGIQLSLAYLEPQGSPKGIVQLVHGMCEHKERYYSLMEYFCDAGYVCVIHDHRGHGGSVKTADDLGYMYDGGWKAMVEDVELVRKWSARKWPGLRRILMGHSMGSMVVRSYVKRYDSQVDTLIVCGSPSYNPAAGFGRMLAALTAFFLKGRMAPQAQDSPETVLRDL